MSYPRLAMRLYNTPLVITAEKLDVIDRVFRAHEDGRAKLLAPYIETKTRPEVAAAGQAQRTQSGYLRTVDGVAIVPVIGTLVQRSSYMDAESGLTSYSEIGSMIAAAVSDPQVRGILLEVDSNGGEVSGIFDLAEEMRAVANAKPMFAHANELALSGGYILASAAEAVYTPRTGLIGSIGVRMRHVDQSKYDEKRGMVYTDIIAGAHKNDLSPNEPLSDADRQWAQDHVNHTYAIFVDYVAKMRDIEADAVRATEAQIYHADEAIALGLIDGVATIGETLSLLRDHLNHLDAPSFFSMRAAANASRTSQLSAEADKEHIMAGENKPTPAELAEAQARGFTEGEKAANAAAAAKFTEAETKSKIEAKAAADAAQARIAAILNHDEAKERGKAAHHLALKTQTSVEDAVALLAALPKEQTTPANPLAASMPPNPKVGADPGEGEDTEAATVARIMAAGRKLKAIK